MQSKFTRHDAHSTDWNVDDSKFRIDEMRSPIIKDRLRDDVFNHEAKSENNESYLI